MLMFIRAVEEAYKRFNAWAEDPGCYLTDEEIGVTDSQPRVQLTPYRSRKSHEVAAN